MWAREYELIYIAKPDLSEEDLSAILERTKKVIADRNGHILNEDEWGKKKLAYEIQKYAKGHFMYLLYLGDTDIVNETERTLKLDDSILRFLTVKMADRVDVDTRIALQAERDLAKGTSSSDDDDDDDDGAEAAHG